MHSEKESIENAATTLSPIPEVVRPPLPSPAPAVAIKYPPLERLPPSISMAAIPKKESAPVPAPTRPPPPPAAVATIPPPPPTPTPVSTPVVAPATPDPEICEVDFVLDDMKESEEPVHLKNRNEVYYKMYKEAKRVAKEAKMIALSNYLEAKRIKTTYMLDDIEDSDDDADIFASK